MNDVHDWHCYTIQPLHTQSNIQRYGRIKIGFESDGKEKPKGGQLKSMNCCQAIKSVGAAGV